MDKRAMRTDELDFHLPSELIAQTPAPDRAASRLMHYRKSDRAIEHRQFSELPSLLRAGDLLVFNNTRVISARFTLRKSTGGRIEGLFLSELRPGRWNVLLKGLGKSTPRMQLEAAPDVEVSVVRIAEDASYDIDVSMTEPAHELLRRIGRMPLPPYIKREKDHDSRDQFDKERYQTVYAKESGSVAAPTAGLHFTPELLSQLDSMAVQRAFVTLHVGMGTFKPVSAERLEDHVMHEEHYNIDQTTADALNSAMSEGRRIVAVGTTSARVLESQNDSEPIAARSSSTSIFIYPPYRWKHVGALITNFHLPRSTLIALVASMTGLDEQRRLYAEAIAHRYRFFSYGDAMFIE